MEDFFAGQWLDNLETYEIEKKIILPGGVPIRGIRGGPDTWDVTVYFGKGRYASNKNSFVIVDRYVIRNFIKRAVIRSERAIEDFLLLDEGRKAQNLRTWRQSSQGMQEESAIDNAPDHSQDRRADGRGEYPGVQKSGIREQGRAVDERT